MLWTTFDKTRVRKYVATTRTSNIRFMKSGGECRNRERPCFHLFFDQRPRNYIIVRHLVSYLWSFTQLLYFLHFPYFRDENIVQQTNEEEHEMIIIWILTLFRLLSERVYLICDKRYLFFYFFFSFEKSRWRIYEIELICDSFENQYFNARGYFMTRKLLFLLWLVVVKLVWIVCHDTAKIRDLRFLCSTYLQFNLRSKFRF